MFPDCFRLNAKHSFLRSLLNRRSPATTVAIYENLLLRHQAVIYCDYVPLKSLDPQRENSTPLWRWCEKRTIDDLAQAFNVDETRQMRSALLVEELPDSNLEDALQSTQVFVDTIVKCRKQYVTGSEIQPHENMYASAVESARRVTRFLYMITVMLFNIHHASKLNSTTWRRILTFLLQELHHPNIFLGNHQIETLQQLLLFSNLPENTFKTITFQPLPHPLSLMFNELRYWIDDNKTNKPFVARGSLTGYYRGYAGEEEEGVLRMDKLVGFLFEEYHTHHYKCMPASMSEVTDHFKKISFSVARLLFGIMSVDTKPLEDLEEFTSNEEIHKPATNVLPQVNRTFVSSKKILTKSRK